MSITITMNMMTLIGIILGIMSIVAFIIIWVLERDDKIGAYTWFFATVLSACVLVISIWMTGTGIDRQLYKLNEDETVISVTPTISSLPLERGDTIKIYGYAEDNTVYEDNADKEYTVYSKNCRNDYSMSPINVRCTTSDAKELREILSKSKNVEVVKVSP